MQAWWIGGLALLVQALAACTPLGVAIGAGATTGVAASQERGIKHAATDNMIGLRVNDKLLQRDMNLFARVSVSVMEGRVLLAGAVRDRDIRDEAGQLAWQVEGVREVLNEIQVVPEGGFDFGRDTWITTQLRARIMGDRQVVDINYSIETVNGTVYLLGIAQSQAEIDRIVEHARSIAGVRRVVPHILLKTDPRRHTA